MALTTQQKTKVIEQVRIHDKDTGSSEAQIALFTKEIESLAKHLKKHGKDNSSRLGLLKMVAKRKRLMDFLKRDNPKRHASLSKKLGLDK
ncbi:MAG: 30S ribosomal protein S15 [Candidatus Pacebacteria bacterium]|nr:30S ribosomal protein S15 [Candidatus Paceibacterota bacterium]